MAHQQQPSMHTPPPRPPPPPQLHILTVVVAAGAVLDKVFARLGDIVALQPQVDLAIVG